MAPSWAHKKQFPLHNMITLHYKQLVKSSLSKPQTDSQSGIQDHNPNVQKGKRTGFFSKADHSTRLSYLPSMLPGQETAGQRKDCLPLIMIHLCCFLVLSTEISPELRKHVCMPRFKENVTLSQRKKLHCFASKEITLVIINEALGSDVMLMFLAPVRRVINIQ